MPNDLVPYAVAAGTLIMLAVILPLVTLLWSYVLTAVGRHRVIRELKRWEYREARRGR